jgi:hypothetical protein
MKRPTRWSYSAWSTYEACPAQYAYSYIHKLEWKSTPAMERGIMLHSMAEDFMNDRSMPVPYELRKIGRILDDLRNRKSKPEATWLADRLWRVTESQPNAWTKAIVDVHYVDGKVLHLRDYKSGREYPSHRSQLEFYSVLGLIKYPEVERVESGAIYIDGGFEANEGSIIRQMMPKLIEKWNERGERMENDTSFIAAPGGHCKWCPYRASAGGPCGESAKAGV